MNEGFRSFSTQHFGALVVFILFTVTVIWIGVNSEERTKKWIGFSISFLAFSVMVMDLVYRLITSTLDIKDDLPFFLCDVVVIMLPLIIWNQNRNWLGILYFWAVAGTLQALLTPELEDGFPSFNYFRYFIMHAGIVTAVIYSVMIWKIRIGWRDFLNAILFAQVYIVTVHLINIVLKSNYSYTMEKPESATIMDLMGPWPWYILTGELVMIVLFLLLMIPFAGKETQIRHTNDAMQD